MLTFSKLKDLVVIKRGEVMKSDKTLTNLAPILRPSDVVHNRVPERLSSEYDEPLPTRFVTARMGDVAVCLHFSPGSACVVSEELDGSIPTQGVALCTFDRSSNRTHSDYLRVWLLSGVLEDELQRLQIGSHMATVKLSDLEQVSVPLPDLATQIALCRPVVDARESAALIKNLAHETDRLLKLQNELFIAKINEFQSA